MSSFIEEEGMSVDELKALIEYIEQGKKTNYSLCSLSDRYGFYSIEK